MSGPRPMEFRGVQRINISAVLQQIGAWSGLRGGHTNQATKKGVNNSKDVAASSEMTVVLVEKLSYAYYSMISIAFRSR